MAEPAEQLPVDTAAIEARVRAEMEAKFNEEKQSILGNRDQILEEKRALEQKFKGFDEDKFSQFQEFQKKVENDEMLKLAAEGQFEELSHRLMSSREKAWNETQAEYEERIKAAQGKAEEYEAQVNELKERNLGMRKHQFLKELTGSDDSFKSDYFGDFYALQSNRMQIDEDNGSVYALDESGQRIVDTDGNFVKFEDHYSKMKVNHGLFWNAGSGSGTLAYSGGAPSGQDLSKMTPAERAELRKELGDDKYVALLRKK